MAHDLAQVLKPGDARMFEKSAVRAMWRQHDVANLSKSSAGVNLRFSLTTFGG